MEEQLRETLASVPHSELCQQSLEQVLKSTDDQTKLDQAASWMTWARKTPDLKIVKSQVPWGILPQGCSGVIHDVRVDSRGPDDAIYDKHKDIRDKVARGNSFLELAGMEPGIRCIIYALKKFTGGLGDDDDRERGDNSTWKQYFTKPLDDARKVVCTRKANGEAAHLSARHIGSHKYICTGSKNVHMIIRHRDDIDKYEGDRYRIAGEVAHTICDLLDDLTPEKRTLLLDFLCRSELTGVFEILNPTHQHVENFSYMKRAELRFITWTLCNLVPDHDLQLCSMAPHAAIEIARALSLPTVEYDVIDVDQVDARMKQIRQGYGYEGEVLYFMDANHNVIGLLKKKTIWYILCRAIREKVRVAMNQNLKNSNTYSIQQSITKLERRVDEIQKWLGLDDTSTRTWKDLGRQCLTWCITKQDTGYLHISSIADMYPVTWQKYLDDTHQSDRIEMKWEEPTGSDD